MEWDKQSQLKFQTFISKMPVFHRRITEEAVTKRACQRAVERQSHLIQEEDIVAAFFSDVPSPFYSMMIRLLDQTGFDYRKYGYPKNQTK